MFGSQDLDTIRGIIAGDESLNRREIAARTCQELRWTRADGRLKVMSCRVALLRLDKLGLIRLPPPLNRNGNGKKYQPAQTLDPPLFPIPAEMGSVEGLGVSPDLLTSPP